MESSGGGSRSGSAASRLIDVTSNKQLLLPSVTAAVSLAAEVLDQHKMLKNEVEQRDKSSTERNKERQEAQKGAHNYFTLDIPVTREQLSHYRNAAETARSELAALLVKYECAQAELLELKSKTISKDVSIQELKAEVESYKENEARQSSLLFSMQSRIQEIEKESGTIAISKKQAELKVETVLQENLELKKAICEQEGEIRHYVKEYEESKIQASKASRVHDEFIANLCHSFDIRDKEEPQELLLSKISGVQKENAVLKGQIATLEEAINVHEMESKASRETITRLVSELSKEQKNSAVCFEDMEKLSKDLSSTITAKQNLEKEVRSLQERLVVSQKAWEASQKELSYLKRCSSKQEESLRSCAEEARAGRNLHNAFKEKIITLLQNKCNTVSPSEEIIVETIREMCHVEESNKTMVSQLEAQIANLNEALTSQTTLQQEFLQRAKKAENTFETLHDQLMHLESELVFRDVACDAWKLEKQKYLKFLDQLSEKINLDSMATDIGFDMRMDAVLARAEQLIRLEGDTLTENKIMARNLQRKLKIQKEKLDSKELHVKLLHQKIIQLEEEKQVRTALAVERDDANLTVRKLQKKLERLQNELVLARDTNTDLKIKLADANELKIKTLEQDRTIDDLSKSQEKLEKTKTKTEKQLAAVKSELHVVEREAREDKERAKNILESITSEVKTLKTSLEEVMKRERQLSDFREVVSQMLGLNIATVALPDYEIITRLEGLIHSHQHHFVPCVCFKDMAVRHDGSLQLTH
ncbi:coiled-coil domain-containing protein 170 isoform X1 [Heteronotia binoei]|uniref:coiled-coil domain-containing protein 170 isoform X1 n=1 Tax=Heteronotia binoei TaxID=13085 RepID=UPI002931CA4B|nr:coiled-coil domain-containing protein 170 isoform X1 [Heteronotia binoei]